MARCPTSNSDLTPVDIIMGRWVKKREYTLRVMKYIVVRLSTLPCSTSFPLMSLFVELDTQSRKEMTQFKISLED